MSSSAEIENVQEELLEERILSSSTAAASFSGKLNLESYTYSQTSLPPRRSPRNTTQESSSSSSTTTSQPPPIQTLKRKSTNTLSSPTSSSPRKKSRSPAGYAPPSKYAHLSELIDIFAPSLICIFIGLNPGVTTATQGHAYAHPSNLFWKLLHSSGITTRRLSPSEDRSLPELFQLGNTNIVSRPSRNGAELSKDEMDDGVSVLEDKIRQWKPESVCIVGKSIWESIWRVRHGKKIAKHEFKYGWQEEKIGAIEGDWEGARIFVATTTSGLAASLSQVEKEAIWRELGAWVEVRRSQREAEAAADSRT